MIVMKLQGGLGNQLFQWAYAKTMSLKFGVDYTLDKSNFDVCFKHFYALDRLPSIENDYKDLVKSPEGLIHITDPLRLNITSIDPKLNYYFDGFWQSEQYFINNSDTIRSYIKPFKGVKDYLHIRYSSILDNSVSLHVRRTDYVDSNGCHPVLDLNYYTKALENLKDVNNILVFSDDIPWCKEVFKFENMTFIEGNNNIEDLVLMSMCSHNIIANSSFSWWGSWLNENPDKIVVAPKTWFGAQLPGNNNHAYLSNWITI